jgi:hypothetical protein
MGRSQVGRCLFALAMACWAGCAGTRSEAAPTPEQLAGASYGGIYEEPVQLRQGRYEGPPFVSGGASRPVVQLLEEPMATGDLDGHEGDEAAVFLVESSGGSGSFVYLAAVGLRNGEPVHLGTALVGDRTKIQAVAIEDSEIRVNLLEHGPQDPACCPGEPVTRIWVFEGGDLVPVEEN